MALGIDAILGDLISKEKKYVAKGGYDWHRFEQCV